MEKCEGWLQDYYRITMRAWEVMNINTQLHIFLTRIRFVSGGMGWVHHSWLSCNPPICWMRQNMANGHPGLRSLEDMSLPVWDTESSAWTRWHIMFVMVTHCPDLGAQRTQTWLLSVKAVKDLLFPWSGSLVRRRGATHIQTTIYSQEHDFQENWKDILRIERS